MNFNWGVIKDNLAYLLFGKISEGEPGGLLLTIIIGISSGILALTLGLMLSTLVWLYSGWVRRVIFLWADTIRGIPLIFVIFWFYFLLPLTLDCYIPNEVTVILALAFFTSSTVMHITLAGLKGLPAGQLEAGLASGLSHWQVLRFILWPQAWPNLFPSWTSLLTSLIKDTSLAFIVNVQELTTVAGQVNNRLQIYPAEIFLLVAVLYYLLCTFFNLLTIYLTRLYSFVFPYLNNNKKQKSNW